MDNRGESSAFFPQPQIFREKIILKIEKSGYFAVIYFFI